MRNQILAVITNVDDKTLKGYVGVVLGIVIPSLDVINSSIQVMAGTGGLVLLFLTIRHKYLQIKELKSNLKKKDHNEKTD